MTAVYCFSANGHARMAAEEIASRLELTVTDMEIAPSPAECETAVVVFPVYGNGIPRPAESFLRCLCAENVAVIAVYGGISHGRVLSRGAGLSGGRIICGAYIPVEHTYLDTPEQSAVHIPQEIIERIQHPRRAALPKEPPDPSALFFPKLRGRALVGIRRSDSCTGCGACTKSCPVGAMDKGRPNRECMRCLRCVNICPQGALSAVYAPLLRAFLRRVRREKTEIYL